MLRNIFDFKRIFFSRPHLTPVRVLLKISNGCRAIFNFFQLFDAKLFLEISSDHYKRKAPDCDGVGVRRGKSRNIELMDKVNSLIYFEYLFENRNYIYIFIVFIFIAWEKRRKFVVVELFVCSK